jgi:integrase
MANVHFYLKSGQKNKKGQQPIVMRITHDYSRTIIFIGHSVHSKYWSQKNEKVKPPHTNDDPNHHDTINATIDAFYKRATDAITKSITNGIPITEAYLKNSITLKEDKSTGRSFFGLFDEYIEMSKPIRAHWTIKGYGTVKQFLLDFEEATGRKIDINSIDNLFFDRFRTYAFSVRKVQDNYFSKIVNVLKSFMNWAYDRKYVKTITHKKFSAPEREKEIIYLTKDELLGLLYHDFKSKKLSQARDLFCFMCFTGLRVSDMRDLTHEQIKGDEIQKTIVKTQKIERIPLNRFAKEILAKYPGEQLSVFPSISPQKLNDYIKECCEEVKMNEQVRVQQFIGGKVKTVVKPKHKFITNHVARKTFVTLSFIFGMDTKIIKSITGHKKDSSFNKYIKIAEEFKKEALKSAWDVQTLPEKKAD